MINLVEKLKNCPVGTKLYSPVCGEVEFLEVERSEKYPIGVKRKGEIFNFTKEGKYLSNEFCDGECLLFPSKDNRDWSTFKVKKPKFDVNCLKPFDKILVRDKNDESWHTDFFSHYQSDSNFVYKFATVGGRFAQCIPYRDETAKLLGTTNQCPEYYKNWD